MHESTLVVFSHLRWNFVFQRPQHLLTRLASKYRVLFVEEPLHDLAAKAHWELTAPARNITVCRPHILSEAAAFDDEQLGPLIRDLVDEHATHDYSFWFYTPMALPAVRSLEPRVVVYDCMDELSAFRFAPQQLLDRERELLEWADVVFTGGPSLYRVKKNRHNNCHCFPSSVDAVHFGQATSALAEPPEQASIPRPRLGYFGVIDERFDTPLLAALADARPHWQFVLVGPTAKIESADLPQRSNIHYMGQKSYEALPAFLNGWDVALLPFARNEATRFISPTKTLEYMAAEKPIVSTRITDVAEPYGSMVGLGDSAEEFLLQCERALNEPDTDRRRRREQYRSVLANTSWDTTASAMIDLIEAAKERKSPIVDRVRAQWPSRHLSDDLDRVVVIGAGPTGLSAAYHLGEQALLLEANEKIGGWCRSLVDRGFTFDFAGHIMFSNDPYVHEMYKLLLGDNVHWQDREAWIYSKEVYTRYPFQGSLYGLPPEVIKECIVGAIEARFGSLKTSSDVQPSSNGHSKHLVNSKSLLRNGNGHSPALVSRLTGSNGHHANSNGTGDPKDASIEDCCGDGIVESTALLVNQSCPQANGHAGPRNFEEFIYQIWGAGIAKHFAIPYNRKIWAVPLDEMETSWLGGRVPLPDLEEMIQGALSPKPKPMGPNARFGYPLRGGFQSLMDGFLPLLRSELRLNAKVKAISPSRRTLRLSNGEEIRYRQLISTMPLPALVRAMGDEVPPEVERAAASLRYTSVRCVNIGVGREQITEKHWIYYPEDSVFHRIFVQGNASPHCNPPGGFGLTCEITYGPLKPLPCDGDALIQRCIEDCVKVGIIRADDPIWAANQVDLPFAYVVYDHARPHNVAVIRAWLDAQDIHLAGRYSEWEYYNSDHAFLAGKKAAEQAQARINRIPRRDSSAQLLPI